MSKEQKLAETIYKKLQSFEGVCFNHCIKEPQSKLDTNEEQCLKTCSMKMLAGLQYMNSLSKEGNPDFLSQPAEPKKSRSFF